MVKEVRYMLGEEENKVLDEFADVMAANLMTTSKEPYSNIWPAPKANILEARWYSHSSFPKMLLDMIGRLEEKGYKESDIANLLGGPSKICLFLFWVDGKKTLNMPKDDIATLAVKLITYISHYRRGDIWCRDGRNLILSGDSLSEITKDLKGFDLKQEEHEKIKNSAATINATLWLYTELLYFASHAWGHESHGPYKITGDRYLVVREYYDLKPPFWAFAKHLVSNKITTLEIYDKEAEIAFDMFSRARSKGVPLKCLLRYDIKIGGVDGKSIETIEELKKLETNIVTTASMAAEFESKLDKKELIEKFNEATYWAGIKPIAAILGEKWEPPEETYDMIDKEEALRSGFLIQKLEGLKHASEVPDEVLYKILRDSFDPRVE